MSFRRSRYLTCFYCGQRTSTLNDGTIRRFECPNCDATNFLDENGEITDPPVATTEEALSTAQYAVPRSSPNGRADASGTFCNTCLKNQHLFTASLAQYLPEDPDHPEYAELERKYYNFRKGLEQRYPQVCADCEPKVLERIKQAGYTAKTDHLRRMIDRSRKSRTAQKSPVDIVDAVGKRLWQAGLLLQLLWQAAVLFELASNRETAQSSNSLRGFLSLLQPLFNQLPSPDRIVRWSMLASVLGCWWNPRFVQTIRGFTKHVIGLSNWYAYQAMIIFIRIMFPRLSGLPTGAASPDSTKTAAHVFTAIFTIYIHFAALRCVRTDTTPLFGDAPTTLSPPRESAKPQADDQKNISEILDEILASSPAWPADQSPGNLDPFRPKSQLSPTAISSAVRRPLGNPYDFRDTKASHDLQLHSLDLSSSTPPSQSQSTVAYEEEMDWSPTQSRHRAFNSFDPAQSSRGFSQAPVEEQRSQFWYKVPPAPTSPAQRIFNPPNQIRLRKSPMDKKDSFSFRGPAAAAPTAPDGPSSSSSQGVAAAAAKKWGVEFKDAEFFPPPPPNDPLNSLSDLFTQSFNLDQPGATSSSSGMHSSATYDNPAARRARQEQLRAARLPAHLVEIVLLVAALFAWHHASTSDPPHARTVLLGIVAVCSAISLRVTLYSLRDFRRERAVSEWVSGFGIVLGIVEMVLWWQFGMQIWASNATAFPAGIGDAGDGVVVVGGREGGGGSWLVCEGCADRVGLLIGVMTAHQVWNTIV